MLSSCLLPYFLGIYNLLLFAPECCDWYMFIFFLALQSMLWSFEFSHSTILHYNWSLALPGVYDFHHISSTEFLFDYRFYSLHVSFPDLALHFLVLHRLLCYIHVFASCFIDTLDAVAIWKFYPFSPCCLVLLYVDLGNTSLLWTPFKCLLIVFTVWISLPIFLAPHPNSLISSTNIKC